GPSTQIPVRNPAAGDRTQRAAHLERGEHPPCMSDLYMLRVEQDRRPPIKYRIADGINEEVRQRNDPDVLVAKDTIDNEESEFSARFVLFGVKLSALNFRQADRRRRVGQSKPNEDHDDESDRGRNQK